MKPVEVVLAFIDCINQRDPDRLAAWMTEDHVFIDALGHTIRGREAMRKAWQGYYSFCPDYWIAHEDIFENGGLVAVFGMAGGTISVQGKLLDENQWRIPAAWRAVVDHGLVREWRVYADNKPVYDILAKSAKPTAK